MKPELQRRRFDFFKEAYERELVRRSESMDRLGIVVTAFTIIGGMVAFYANGLPSERTDWFYAFYILFCLGSLLALIGIVLFAFQAQWGVFYKVLGPAAEFDVTFNELDKAAEGATTTNNSKVLEFDNAIADQYRDGATFNKEANDLREKRSNRVLRIAAWSSTLLIIAALPYLVSRNLEKKQPLDVTIENPISINEQSKPSGK